MAGVLIFLRKETTMNFDFLKTWSKKYSKYVKPKDIPSTTIISPPVMPEIKEPEIKPTPPRQPIPKKERPVSRSNAYREFIKIFKQLIYRHPPWEIWKDFVTLFACALSNPVDKSHYELREALYMDTIKKYNKQEQNLFPELVAKTVLALEDNPEQDFLGEIYMELGLGNNAKAQIFTPYHVCELMASITGGDFAEQVKKEGYITINDPCCGGGATLIASIHQAKRELEEVGLNWQNHILIIAQDIDFTVAMMCYIQLSLLGAAAYVKVGNALTEPMTTGDSLENYWFTPLYFSDVWSTRRLIKKMSSLFDEKETKER